MTIIVDTREKKHIIPRILAYFDKNGIEHIHEALNVGDYMLVGSPQLAIDRKYNLPELVQNVASKDHARFTRELERAKDAGIKLIVLCEHGGKIKCLADVNTWYNPRLRTSPLAVSGQRLFKILYTISKKYDVEFVFCNKLQTGAKIVELLTGGGMEEEKC